MNTVYAVYGASGLGKEVMPILREQISGDNYLCFVDDNSDVKLLNGIDVLTYSNFLKLKYKNKFVSIAISDSGARKFLIQRLNNDGISVLTLKAKNVVIMDNVSIGEGAILCAHSTLTSNIKIGKSFHANLYSYVAHDCLIGDFVTFAPGVKCNGNVIIEDHVYIGTGAMIKQGTKDKPLIIGSGSKIGIGSVVIRSVKPGDTVFGSPAKSILTKSILKSKELTFER